MGAGACRCVTHQHTPHVLPSPSDCRYFLWWFCARVIDMALNGTNDWAKLNGGYIDDISPEQQTVSTQCVNAVLDTVTAHPVPVHGLAPWQTALTQCLACVCGCVGPGQAAPGDSRLGSGGGTHASRNVRHAVPAIPAGPQVRPRADGANVDGIHRTCAVGMAGSQYPPRRWLQWVPDTGAIPSHTLRPGAVRRGPICCVRRRRRRWRAAPWTKCGRSTRLASASATTSSATRCMRSARAR